MGSRDKIGRAIVKAFEDDYLQHGTSYDPDTCYRAADEVIAVLLSELTGEPMVARFHPLIIGPAEFVLASAAGATQENAE